jgi:epoxyqueuosine reductase
MSSCGIARATNADTFPQFEHWLDSGYAGEMQYLHKHREARRHPASILSTVRSVIMMTLDYLPGSEAVNPTTQRTPRIAAYARHPDYHEEIWRRLNALRDWLQTEVPGCVAHGTCDTAPLLERDFARRAGLGWIGKNTMLIHKSRGSFSFLAALLTSLDLPADAPHTRSHCGTCRACLDACPTHAFPSPGVLDASKCISYFTIELRSAIPEAARPLLGEWIFGCDVCQDVCPWNRKAKAGALPRNLSLPILDDLAHLDPLELVQLTESEFRKRFKGTSLLRTRRSGFVRNVLMYLGNFGTSDMLPILDRLAQEDSSDVVRDAAHWASQKIRTREKVGEAG